MVLAVFGPACVPYDAENYFDYDCISRIVVGTRISLLAGFVSVAAGAVVGTARGLIAGYYEGWADRVIMRI